MAFRSRYATGLAITVLAVGIGAISALVRDNASRAQADETSALARGATIYAEACASCHGAELEGQLSWRSPGPDGRMPAPPHDETGHTWHHSDRILFEITKHGSAAVVGGSYESDMPGFGEAYSDDEIRDVLTWIKTQWPEREREYQAQITAKDKANE